MSTLLQAFFGFFARKNRHQANPGRAKVELHQNVEWIPLPEAAQLMYDELDGTHWRREADGEPTLDARLDYMAIHLVRNAPIEGRSPSSSSYKPIASSEFNAGAFKSGGKYFQRDYESYLTFVDMRVRAGDLRDALQRMKATR
jgi:hypothetical protein